MAAPKALACLSHVRSVCSFGEAKADDLKYDPRVFEEHRAMGSFQQRLTLMPGWSTEVVIDAPLQLVWQRATDFAGYSEWNPFVVEAHADFAVGQTIRFLEDLKQFGQHWITAEFLEIEPSHWFVWQGHFAAPFLFTVRHSFKFEALNERQTRFTQIHQNSGLLIPFLALRGIYCVSYQGYLDFDQALKVHCETLTGENL